VIVAVRVRGLSSAWLVEAARRRRAAAADPSRVRTAAEMFAAVRERFPAKDVPSR